MQEKKIWEFLLWLDGLGSISAAPGHKFNPRPGMGGVKGPSVATAEA